MSRCHPQCPSTLDWANTQQHYHYKYIYSEDYDTAFIPSCCFFLTLITGVLGRWLCKEMPRSQAGNRSLRSKSQDVDEMDREHLGLSQVVPMCLRRLGDDSTFFSFFFDSQNGKGKVNVCSISGSRVKKTTKTYVISFIESSQNVDFTQRKWPCKTKSGKIVEGNWTVKIRQRLFRWSIDCKGLGISVIFRVRDLERKKNMIGTYNKARE